MKASSYTSMTGRERKIEGQQMALFGAGQPWVEYILDKLRAFCKVRVELDQPKFRFEEFREVAEKSGWDLPPTSKSWGALPRIAIKAGIIQSTNEYVPAQSKKTHAHPVRVWEAVSLG